MRPSSRILKACAVLVASLCANFASAQTPVPYNRIGTWHAGIECFTFDDVLGDSWRFVNTPVGTVPLDTPVRITAVAIVGIDATCAAVIGTLEVLAVVPVGVNPGTDFCFGNGGDQMGCTNCPCTNDAAVDSRGGCLNSSGRSARLLSEGSTSLTTADLCFRMRRGVAASFAILISGTSLAPANPGNPCFANNPGSGIQSIAFDGLRCVTGTTLRHGGRGIDANGEVGMLTNPWGYCAAGFPGNAAFISGHTRYFQAIYRDLDTAVCQRSLNTTQATRISFTP